jgi:predicted DNA binding CopG/RHH family protein
MRKKRPKIKGGDEERTFPAIHDSTEYVDWSKAKLTRFPNLRPSDRRISIRLPEFLLERIKILAYQRNMPYQILLKILLAEKVRETLQPRNPKDDVFEEENRRLWAKEALRRYREIKGGKIRGKTAAMVMRGARARLRSAEGSDATEP